MPGDTRTGLKYLFVAPRYHTNQVWPVRALKDAGHEVDFVVLYHGATESHVDLHPEIAQLSWLSRALMAVGPRLADPLMQVQRFGFPALAWAWSYFRKHDPDVLVVRNPNLPFSLVWMAIGRLHGKRIILYTQGRMVLRPAYKELVRAAMIRLCQGAWMTPLRFPDDEPAQVHPMVFYVPFVAPPPVARDRAVPGAQDPVRVLGIGKYVARKNHLLLLDALEDELRAGRALLTLAGEDSSEAHHTQLERIRAAVAGKGLGHAVTILTNVAFERMAELYLGADVFVLPSRDEPAAVSILEAMAFGLPSLCSTTNGTRYYITEGHDGFVFRSDDPVSLREKLQPLLRDRELLRRMSAHAHATAAETLSGRAYVARMTEIVRTLASSRPR
jgi:glycosyltransferase involved in cell wall biosynthesis